MHNMNILYLSQAVFILFLMSIKKVDG